MARKLQSLEDLRKVKPNWEHWGRMHEITLPEAIALLFDVEPSDDLIEFGDWSGWRDYRFRAEDMQRRLKLALSHLRAGGGLRRTDVSLTRPSTNNWREFTFVTSEFGSWALSLRLGIPEEFPRGTGTVAVRTGANSRAFEIPHASTKLVKALALLESFGGNIEDFPSSTDLAKLIRKHCNPEVKTTSLSTEASIAAFLRPDSLRDSDGRAGKSKTRD